MAVAVDDVGQVEDRQEHADDHAADDDAKKANQDWLDERHEAGERGFNFLVQKVRDAFEHVRQFFRSVRLRSSCG